MKKHKLTFYSFALISSFSQATNYSSITGPKQFQDADTVNSVYGVAVQDNTTGGTGIQVPSNGAIKVIHYNASMSS